MKDIQFKTTAKELLFIIEIGKRAIRYGIYMGETPMMDCQMDLAACHANGTELDFEKLIEFDDFNFAHDINGIKKNLNRSTGELENCFLPRCAR